MQKRATEGILGLKKVLNGERLKALSLPCLLERRLGRDMSVMCKYFSIYKMCLELSAGY